MKKLLLILPFLWVSCQDVIELDLPEGEALLVVEGQITNRQGDTQVVLTQSVPYFTEEGNPPVQGAIVALLENGAVIDTLQEEAPGFYTSDRIGVLNNEYSVLITLLDGRTYSSANEVLPRVPPIDSLYYRFETDLQFLEDGYYAYFATQELPGGPEYYRWKYYFNQEYQNTPFDIQIADDEFVDGNYIADFAVSFDPFEVNDTVRVEQLSSTRSYYEYWTLISTQTAQVGGPFDPPPAPVIGNVKRADGSDEVVLGFFSAHGLSVAETIIVE